MKANEFCYWLQGVFEVGGVKSLNETQTEIVRRHLALVFLHDIDPKEPGDPAVSQVVHDGAQPIAPGAGIPPKGALYRC